MVQASSALRRVNPRYTFFADVEATLHDGTLVLGQLSELSCRGCYIDTLEPIPIGTQFDLRICDGMTTCELQGKAIYMHSGSGLGIFGIGVVFGEVDIAQRSAIDAWLSELACSKRTPALNET
jgi:PilZ domain-containing protein